MDTFTKNDLSQLMEVRNFACVSIYMPTFRTSPEAKQNPIRFKNLLKQMEQRLIAAGIGKSEAKALSAYGKTLLKNGLFWQYQSDGFVAFISSERLRYYRLPAAFEELLVITDRYHLKPLLPLLANEARFYILALSLNEVKLFRCSRYHIAEVELENAPVSLSEALALDEPTKQLQIHTTTSGGKGDKTAVIHGHGAGKDEAKNNILRFFQQVDHRLQKILRDDPAPLVLAGVDYLLPIYREANSYSQLMERGITGNPEALKPEVLQKEAWIIVEPHFLKDREEATARYRQLAGSAIASNDVKTIALAAYQGRVDLLFTTVGIQQWGAFDPTDLSIRLHEKHKPGDEDILDFAAVHALLKGGTVHAVKPEEMPDGARLAAIFRY
jgi:hypothetical protein